jgi:hypothetical protein
MLRLFLLPRQTPVLLAMPYYWRQVLQRGLGYTGLRSLLARLKGKTNS